MAGLRASGLCTRAFSVALQRRQPPWSYRWMTTWCTEATLFLIRAFFSTGRLANPVHFSFTFQSCDLCYGRVLTVRAMFVLGRRALTTCDCAIVRISKSAMLCADTSTSLMRIWTAFLGQQRKRRSHRLLSEQQSERFQSKLWPQGNARTVSSATGCRSVEGTLTCPPKIAHRHCCMHVWQKKTSWKKVPLMVSRCALHSTQSIGLGFGRMGVVTTFFTESITPMTHKYFMSDFWLGSLSYIPLKKIHYTK